MPISRHAALLWLTLLLGAAVEPVRADGALPEAVQGVRDQLRAGRIEEAIEAGEGAVAQLAQDARAWFWLGRAYAQQAMRAGLLSKAKWAGKTREAYEKAVALDPAHVDARFDLMQYYLLAPGFLGGGRDKADAQAAALRAQDPVLGKLADARLAQQDDAPAQAERAYRDALVLDPASERARIALSLHLQRSAQWEPSAALWREVLAERPDDALAHYQLARLAVLAGSDPAAGLEHLQRYLAAPQENDYMSLPGAHWRRGQLLAALGRREEARAALEEALRLQPSLEPARESLDALDD